MKISSKDLFYPGYWAGHFQHIFFLLIILSVRSIWKNIIFILKWRYWGLERHTWKEKKLSESGQLYIWDISREEQGWNYRSRNLDQEYLTPLMASLCPISSSLKQSIFFHVYFLWLGNYLLRIKSWEDVGCCHYRM